MKVTRLSFQNFRNLQEGELFPDPETSVICGSNAQGKTNLLEALWLFTGGKSFRGAKDAELVAFGKESARLSMEFFSEEREQRAKIFLSEGRRAGELNGVHKNTPAQMVGSFCAVVFSPEHLSLVKEGPAFRRKFLDGAICQCKPSYLKLLSGYNRVLLQRNTLLKDIPRHSELTDTLEIWDERLSRYGGAVAALRLQYVKRLSEYAKERYDGISGGKEIFLSEYAPSYRREEEEDAASLGASLLKTLQKKRREDIFAGFTTEGPHRDDLILKINGISARAFGSQGQQRSAVLALKLSEAQLLLEDCGERPVILLDDVMSELDAARQDYLLHSIDGWQVFITCCDPASVMRLRKGSVFEIKKGSVTAQDGGKSDVSSFGAGYGD